MGNPAHEDFRLLVRNRNKCVPSRIPSRDFAFVLEHTSGWRFAGGMDHEPVGSEEDLLAPNSRRRESNFLLVGNRNNWPEFPVRNFQVSGGRVGRRKAAATWGYFGKSRGRCRSEHGSGSLDAAKFTRRPVPASREIRIEGSARLQSDGCEGRSEIEGGSAGCASPKKTRLDGADCCSAGLFLDRPEVDTTGLTGVYDYTLDLSGIDLARKAGEVAGAIGTALALVPTGPGFESRTREGSDSDAGD